MYCDSITFCSQNIKYFLKRKNEIIQNFMYQLNNDNIKINEKINTDEQVNARHTKWNQKLFNVAMTI